MKDFVEYIIKNLVDNPDQVAVVCIEGKSGLIVEVRVAKDDIGKVLGRRGNTIKAIRTILSHIATRIGKFVRVELIED